MKIVTFLFVVLAILHNVNAASCGVDTTADLCACSWDTGTPAGTVGVCDVVDENAVVAQYQALVTQFNSLTTQLDGINTNIDNVQNQLNFISDGLKNLPNYINQIGDSVKNVGDFFGDVHVKSGIDAIVSTGKALGDIVKTSVGNEYDFKGIVGDPLDTFIDAVDEVSKWIVNALVTPASGVFKAVEEDCWYKLLSDAVIQFDVGIDNGPGVGFGIAFAGNDPLKCFLSKLRLFASLLGRTEPKALSVGFETLLQFKTIAANLRKAVGTLNSTFSTSSKPAFCSKTLSLNFSIPANSGYDFIDDFINGLNQINKITSGDGVIGQVVNALKDFACDASSVPGALTVFANKLADFLDNRKATAPTAIVGKLFNGIQFVANKFIDLTNQFEDKVLNQTGDDVPCMLKYWNLGQIWLNFGFGFELKVFPPKEVSFSGGICCVSLDCWGCLTGVDELLSLINLIPGKRSVLANTTASNSTTTATFLSSGFSVKTNSKCVVYGCNGGTWNDNVCACVCTDPNNIWTPQYGCYNAVQYENGNSPSGANPKANPNNPNYDPTVDPYSDSYDPSKDPNPYYNPYAVVTNTPDSSYSLVLSVCLLLLAIFMF